MDIYDQLKFQNALFYMRPAIQRKWYEIRNSDQKIVRTSGMIDIDTSWVHTGRGYGYDCFYWHRVLFDIVFKKIGQKIVPRFCHNCWKVCIKPRTLEQLMEVCNYQQDRGIFSKCGIETRPRVPAHYGAYWYNKGQKKGLECYDLLYQWMSGNEILKPLLEELDEDGKTKRIILKRGCTEFEDEVGPSTEWKITPEQNAIEDLLSVMVVGDVNEALQSEHLIWDVKQRWIEWAWEHDDATFYKYRSKPLFPNYVTYHPPVKKEKEENGIVQQV